MYKNYIQLYKEGYRGKLKIGIKEREAEIFASYLLIPEDKLNTILKEDWVNDSLDPIAELAEEFNVPGELVRKRLEFEKLLSIDKMLTLPIKRFKKTKELKNI